VQIIRSLSNPPQNTNFCGCLVKYKNHVLKGGEGPKIPVRRRFVCIRTNQLVTK
jgi:hypothetical protein